MRLVKCVNSQSCFNMIVQVRVCRSQFTLLWCLLSAMPHQKIVWFFFCTSSFSRAWILFSYTALWSESSFWATSFAIWIPCIISSIAFKWASSISASSLRCRGKVSGEFSHWLLVYMNIHCLLEATCFVNNIIMVFFICLFNSLCPLGSKKLVFGKFKIFLAISCSCPAGHSLSRLDFSWVVKAKVVVST